MKIAYWVTTALVAFAFGAGGVFDVFSPEAAKALTELGYPTHLAWLLGTWKVLGAAVLLAPGLARLKEWAYAGMVFDLTGAAWSHGMANDPVSKLVTPLVLLAIVFASWFLRPENRKLTAPARDAAATPVAQPASVAAS